jgi:DNA-binding CsgD family transcriptional regulator
MLEMARSAGLAIEPLVADLPFTEASIGHLENVLWDDYCTVVERFEDACGGPDGHVAAVLEHHKMLLAPEIRRFMAGLVSPEAAVRFVVKTMCPHAFPTVDFDYASQPDGRLRISGLLRPGARPCAAWFRGSLPYMQTVTTHLGLPPSEIELVELTERSLIFLMRLPESRTLAARMSRRVQGAFAASVEVMRQFVSEGRQRSVELLDAQARHGAMAALGRDLARHQDLDSLTRAIVEGLAQRGWERIALWVTPLGQRSPQLVRSHGPAMESGHDIPLEAGGRTVGRLQLAGRGALSEVEDLSSWLAICLDNARTFTAIGERLGHDAPDVAARLIEVGTTMELTERQRDVLARVVRGRSNKEIASELRCAENTVEHHLTQLFRKTGTEGRTQLAAWFWSTRPMA